MTRDHGLEAHVRACLAGVENLTGKPMFGGLAWMMSGHLLCAAREDGVMIRLGKGNDAEALTRPGVERVTMRGRPMNGWVRVAATAFANDALAQRLVDDAVGFVRSLPDRPA